MFAEEEEVHSSCITKIFDGTLYIINVLTRIEVTFFNIASLTVQC